MRFRQLAFTAFTAIPALLAAASAAGAADYDVDPVHTTALFKVNHFGVSNFLGRFDDVTGAIVWDADAAKSSVKYEIKADSIDTNFAKRDQHLKSPDFLDAKQFPTLSFVSKSVKKVDDSNFVVDGELTIHGVTKPLQVAVVKTGEGKDPMSGASRIGFWSTFSIKRSDFGMTGMVGPIGDAIEITISSEGLMKGEGKK